MNKKAMNKSHRERIMSKVREEWMIVGKEYMDKYDGYYKELGNVVLFAFKKFFPKEASDVLLKYRGAYESSIIYFPKVYINSNAISSVDIPKGVVIPKDYNHNNTWNDFLENNKDLYEQIKAAATNYLSAKEIMDDKRAEYNKVYCDLVYGAKYFDDIINVFDAAKSVYEEVLRETCQAVSVISPATFDAVRAFEKLKAAEANV